MLLTEIEQARQMKEYGCVAGDVQITLEELINSDKQSFLELLSARLVGHKNLQSIGYYQVNSSKDTCVLRVVGVLPEAPVINNTLTLNDKPADVVFVTAEDGYEAMYVNGSLLYQADTIFAFDIAAILKKIPCVLRHVTCKALSATYPDKLEDIELIPEQEEEEEEDGDTCDAGTSGVYFVTDGVNHKQALYIDGVLSTEYLDHMMQNVANYACGKPLQIRTLFVLMPPMQKWPEKLEVLLDTLKHPSHGR